MANYIPFVTSNGTLRLVKNIYPDAILARVPLEIAEKLSLPPTLKLWIDAGADGLDDTSTRRSRPDRKNTWYELMKDIPEFEEVAESSFALRPDAVLAEAFVTNILDRCAKRKPAWITIPQFPIVDDAARNKVNRVLSKATGKWKSSHSFSGRLILPIVFTHQNQINSKIQRNKKISQANRCYHEAQADGFWVVDSSLSDESGSKTLRNVRLPALIALHQELNDEISSRIRIAGPYWGTNLVLWARGLVDYPAIGVGTSYQYHLAGGHAHQPNTRLAVGPLRRRVNVANLKAWLEESLATIGPKHAAHSELDFIYKRLSFLNDPDAAREQVARFYKEWLDMLEGTPVAGRSLALFQDLSGAYALGRSLPELSNEGTARRPESVAEPLMLNCV